MPEPNDLTTLVPQGLIRRLKTHFTEKIEEAVGRYRFNDADEDSLTGALGHALSTPQPVIVTAFKGAVYSFAIESYKILGKGPGTPERRTGADGIIQISVESDGKPIFAKGLPFQAKKLNRYHEAEVAHRRQTCSALQVQASCCVSAPTATMPATCGIPWWRKSTRKSPRLAASLHSAR